MRFKQAYDYSTQNFQIPNQENIARLFEALKGEARETVKTLFASGSNSNDIMRTLELRFGNSKMILEKIISEFSNLPAIGSGKISLLEFASKLKNAVTSIKSLNCFGYLFSPQLYDEILKKIPKTILFNYIRYAQTADVNLSDLEKISEFLFSEAHLALNAGIIDVYYANNSKNKAELVKFPKPRSVFTADVERGRHNPHLSFGSHNLEKKCENCQQSYHEIQECKKFLSEEPKARWKIIRKLKLCYRCLRSGHGRKNCTESNSNCSICQRGHNSLLHFTVDRIPKSVNVVESRSLTGMECRATPGSEK